MRRRCSCSGVLGGCLGESVGGGARARLSWTLICWCAEALCSELRLWREPRLRGVVPFKPSDAHLFHVHAGTAGASSCKRLRPAFLFSSVCQRCVGTLELSPPSSGHGVRANCGADAAGWLLESRTDGDAAGSILRRDGGRDGELTAVASHSNFTHKV